jgi:hypothetical protein
VNTVMNLHKMLGCSWAAAQLAASQEGLSSMSEWVTLFNSFRKFILNLYSRLSYKQANMVLWIKICISKYHWSNILMGWASLLIPLKKSECCLLYTPLYRQQKNQENTEFLHSSCGIIIFGWLIKWHQISQ